MRYLLPPRLPDHRVTLQKRAGKIYRQVTPVDLDAIPDPPGLELLEVGARFRTARGTSRFTPTHVITHVVDDEVIVARLPSREVSRYTRDTATAKYSRMRRLK